MAPADPTGDADEGLVIDLIRRLAGAALPKARTRLADRTTGRIAELEDKVARLEDRVAALRRLRGK